MKPVKNSATSTPEPGNGNGNVSGSKLRLNNRIRDDDQTRHNGQPRPPVARQNEHAQAAAVSNCPDGVPGDSHSERSERSVYSINGAKGGRPMRDVDMDEVRRLLAEGKSVKSTALFLSIGEGTLRRRLGFDLS